MDIRDPRLFVMRVSLAASVVMLVGKLLAYYLTHSVALLSDAAESVVHGVATGLATSSLSFSAKPADANHPYGHGRIAYFSAGFEGALVLVASFAVIYSGISGLFHEPQLEHLGVGLAISGGLALINLALGWSLVHVGNKHNSLILIANGKHVFSDMWTTVAAISGLTLVMATGCIWLDPLVAILIGSYIMLTGASLIRKSFAGLMDELDSQTLKKLVGGLQGAVDRGHIVDFHQLRCRKINDQIWIDVHVLVPGNLSTTDAHDRVTQVETSLHELFPNTQVVVTSHIEPADHESAHPGGHDGISDPLEPTHQTRSS